MKILCFIFFLIFSSLSVLSQHNESFFYNDKGQFRLDTTLTISKSQFATWSKAEFNLVAGFSRIEIPTMYLETVKPEKTKTVIIASFVCDSSDIKDVKVLNDVSWYATAVINGLQKQGKGIASQLKSRSHATSEGVYMGKYYVAISFTLIDFYEQLKMENAVPIIKTTIPLVDSWSH